jgi:TonB family protein
LTAICQDTLLVTEKFNDSKQISESFYVLKSDKKIKNGEYVSYFMMTDEEFKNVKKNTSGLDKFIHLKGRYKNGKKDGQWIEYSQPYVLKTEGKYVADKKVGIWLTYKEKGKVTERFDYDINKKLSPVIQINAIYPDSARDSGIHGTVTIMFYTHPDCSISGIFVTQSLAPDFDKAAIVAINKFGELLKKYGQDCQEKEVEINLHFKVD